MEQTTTKRKETKRGSINHRYENMDVMDSGECSGRRVTDAVS